MHVPQLTVGLPFFNEEGRLEMAIRSLLRQSFGDIEILLVDDGSTDSSLTVARSFDDPRVRVLSDGRRRFLPARLNQIVREARGEWVARMDGDDVVHPTRFARQMDRFRSTPELDVVGTWAGLVDEFGSVVGVVEAPSLPASPRVALERGLLVHASIIARKRWLQRHPYDETLTRAEDRDLWCRSVNTTGFGVVEEPLYVVTCSSRDPDFLPDYICAQQQNRTLYLRHGPAAVGAGRTAYLWVASLGKVGVMRAAHVLGLSEHLIRRRGRVPTAIESRTIREALDCAR